MIREIHVNTVQTAVQKLIEEAAYRLPDDYLAALADAQQRELSPVGRSVILMLQDNAAYAQRERLPTCQDTGMAILSLSVGQDIHFNGGDINVALAAVPTVTEIGMAALLPEAHGDAKVVTAGSGRLALDISGTVVKDRKDRVTFLKKHADVEVFDTKLDALLPKPSKRVREGIASAQLVLVTSQEIDELSNLIF